MSMDFSKCIVCGAPSIGRTGYLFMQNGKCVVGMPFCDFCVEKIGIVLANPVFENEQALALFKQRHPGKYAKYVRGKQIIFLRKEAES